jgi:Ran-binding protein 1
LYRFDGEESEWKERGVGDVAFLRHKERRLVRILMRREKVFKICCNHFGVFLKFSCLSLFLVLPYLNLEQHAGSDKAWVWTCPEDYTEEPQKEIFAIKFGTIEKANDFKKHFDEAKKLNEEILGKKEEETKE